MGDRCRGSARYHQLVYIVERFVDTLEGTLRYVKAKRRSKHDVYLSWDEWQVWYKGDPMQGNWTEAPHLAEEIYNLEDALVVAQWLNVFEILSNVVDHASVAA
jgi:alpha-N-arabinofuranosidase